MATNDTGNTEEQKSAEQVEGQEPDETNEQAESTEEQETEEQSEESNESDEDNEDNEDDDEGERKQLSHEDALKALEKTRKSEAKYRTRLREAEEKLQNAKTPEEFEAARKELSEANAADTRTLLVENVALKHGLPEDLAAALKGDTREELEAHAKTLAKYAPADEDDSDLSGGLDPSKKPDDFDAKAKAKELRRQRRRGR